MLSVQKLALGLYTHTVPSFPTTRVGLLAAMCYSEVFTHGCKAEEQLCVLSYVENTIRLVELQSEEILWASSNWHLPFLEQLWFMII